MDNLITSTELADFLAVTIHDLKNWRRLAPEHPRHLPSTIIAGRHVYDPDEVVAWLVRNPERLAVARFLFDERIALANAAALRDVPEPAPMPPTDAWDGYFTAEHQPDHQPQQGESAQ